MIFDSFQKDKTLHKRQNHTYTIEDKALDFFKEIYSYNDLKDVLYREIIM